MVNNKKEKIIKKRKELEKKLKSRMDQLSHQDKESLQAIAIKYDQQSKKAPTIVASGRGKIATEILSIAEENNIPMVEDEKLSKLLSSLKIRSEVPPTLFKLVAEVLAFVFYLEKMSKKRSSIRGRFRGIK
jgi:flagellar biosynthesis protein